MPAGSVAEPHSTGPVFVGATTAVQLAVSRPINAQLTQPPAVAPPGGPAGTGSLGYRPVSKGQPLAQNISAVLISPPQAPRKHWTPPSGVIMPGQAPSIIGREEWGADPVLRCGTPQYHSGVRAAVVHHTAGSNDYLPQDSAGIIKSIYMYHTRTLGWCDIAYNALVDKYGQVFEGSAGGPNKPVYWLSHRRIQPQYLGCGHARRLRRRATDANPAANGGPTNWLAARDGRRRPQGHGDTAVGWRPLHQLSRPAPLRPCPPSSPTVTSATLTVRATPPTRGWTRSGTSHHISPIRRKS